ncbi:subtilisin-like protease SBT5.6 [Rhodamnia argentea]|uniref:Subtilisin-like protease SBT5.6 n=1 Tax=Rhodamnia argentea TaxID=178133 RepID=A0A8B8QLI3_9MYRT|nr:subtilisin-like protease SBT5.6 [Rhodamnia argentea]
MKRHHFSFLLFIIHLPILAFCSERKVYIVYLGQHDGSQSKNEIEDYHLSHLSSIKAIDVEGARSSLLYSYKNSFNGYAAVLTPDEASRLSELDEVVSVIRSDPRKYSMHTTRSWEFLGLEGEKGSWNSNKMSGGLLQKAKYGRGVTVGILDSGVWPESKSFSDRGMRPVPKSWRGICQTGQEFDSSHCNRKLVGARYYLKGYENYYGPLNTTLDYRSPRDKDGHGTHTASTVGGRRVANVSALGGVARGTAFGGAPLVHLAIYKACWAIPGVSKVQGNTCFEEDMLAAMDDAIGDGVDVISISIGTVRPMPYAQDGIALGAFHAAKSNIVVACSAGNNGPAPGTLSNLAPWIITIGASTVDRTFVAPVELGNGMLIEGQSVTPYSSNKMYPLIYAGDALAPNVSKGDSGQCLPNSLNPKKVRGKIVLCIRGNGTRVGKGMEVKRAGGAGFILGNGPANGAELTCDSHVLPATAVTHYDAARIYDYIRSTDSPTVRIAPARTALYTKPAPVMAAFTSRGPNIIDPNILKPDITAPGVNILAAWSEADSPTKLESDPRIVEYNFESGTSMACPHVAATAALLRAIHKKWSTAAIRSALMTTAFQSDNMGKPITDAAGALATPFALGAGHLMPQRAADPGLVYDASYSDYAAYLCSLGINDPSFQCPNEQIVSSNLNYPSLQISRLNGTFTVTRTVTNVGGKHNSCYFSHVKPPTGFLVTIRPSLLVFDHVGQKRSFTITVKVRDNMVKRIIGDEYAFGWYGWNDGIHNVNSPMAISLA